MEVKDAVTKALHHFAEVFAEEKLSNVGLEEVMYDPARKRWNVTVGFSRPWDYPPQSPIGGLVQDLHKTKPRPIHRNYRVVEINDPDEQVTAIKIREVTVDE